MAKLDQVFDSTQHDDMDSAFEPIPADEYIAQVVESDLCTTAKKTGKYIKLKFEILKGKYKGRFVWTNLNIVNPNSVTVEIAQKAFATLCRAIGKGPVQDTEEVHGRPVKISVKITPAKGDYPPGNKIDGYKPIKTKKVKEEVDLEIENDDIPWEDMPF